MLNATIILCQPIDPSIVNDWRHHEIARGNGYNGARQIKLKPGFILDSKVGIMFEDFLIQANDQGPIPADGGKIGYAAVFVGNKMIALYPIIQDEDFDGTVHRRKKFKIENLRIDFNIAY